MGGSGRPPNPPTPSGGREVRPPTSAVVSAMGTAGRYLMPVAKIAVRGLKHEYVNSYTCERVVALDGIDLDVAEGTALALVGYVWARWAFDRERTR
jgi:ABC-type glutathione transport system ATPase component